MALSNVPAVALMAGQQAVGNVGGKTLTAALAPLITASNAYGTNYVVGGLLEFPNVWTSTKSGLLQDVTVNIRKVETSGFTFVPFIARPSASAWTDAAVAAINANDMPMARASIALSAYSGLGTHTVAYGTALAIPMVSDSTSLWGVLIANAALTNNFSAGDVTISVTTLPDL